RRSDHPTGRGLAAAAGDPDDPAVRGRHHRRARGGAHAGRTGRRRDRRRPRRPMTGAGFWRRYAAWSLDAALIAAASVLPCWPLLRRAGAALAGDYAALLDLAARGMGQALAAGTPLAAVATQWMADPALHAATGALSRSLWALLWPPLLLGALLGAAYHALFEASPRQATPGQRLFGLRVVDVAGARIDRGRALLRHAAGALSWLTLNIGHALAMLRPDRRALHDLVAGTAVV